MNRSTRTHDCRSQFLRLVARAGGARFFLFGILFLAACDSSTYREVVEVEIPAALALEPVALQLEEGDDRGMTLVDSSKPRRPAVSGDWIAWTSSNPSVATMENGVVRAVGPGVATLTARIGGTVATSSVRVVRTPTELELRGPASRVVPVASVLNGPIEAVVLSRAGRPVAGAEVRFDVAAGGGTVSPVVAETDAQGIARAVWTFGLRSGPQQVAAEVLHAGVAKRTLAGQALAGPAFAVRVLPEEVDLKQGTPYEFSAEFVDLYGNFVSEADVDWSTSDPGVVTVGTDGRAMGVSAGQGLVVARPSASSPNFSILAQSPGNGRGNARVRIGEPSGGDIATIALMSGNDQRGPVGQRLPIDLAIRITDSSGAGMRHQDVSWTVARGSATVGSASTRTNPHGHTSTSLTLGSTPGLVVVTVTAESVGSVSFVANAEPGSVSEVVVTPGNASLEKGDKRQFGFSARDRFGNIVTNHAAPKWSTGDIAIATISTEGVATAREGGTTTVRASVDGVSGNSDLTVAGAVAPPAGPAVASVHASTKTVNFTSLGMEATVFAVARDGAGQVVSNATFKWSSSNQGVATVSPAGKIVSKGVGTAMVIVSASCCETARTDTVSVTVTQVAKEIAIDPASMSLKVGDAQGAKVTVKDANGHDLATPGTTTWSSSNAAVMTVAANGMVKAEAAGSAVLTAKSGTLTATAAVQVTSDAPVVASVHASTRSVGFTSLGMEATVSAAAREGNGTVVPGVEFTWASSNQGVATVSPAGKIISKGIGTALIVVSATCCQAAGADTITVTVIQTAKHISIDPGALSLKVGNTQGVKVTLKDANGHDLVSQGTPFWTTSNAAVMTVSPTGVVKAEGAGSAVLTVTSASLSTTAAVAVAADATPPPPVGGVAPLHQENFAGFATVKDYLDGLVARGWPRNESHMDFVNDSPAGVGGQAIRFTFRDATARGGSGREGRCSGPSIGFDYDIRPLEDGKSTEIWDEYWVKYSDNWTTLPPAEWNCTGNPDHKLIFGLTFGTTARFDLLNGNNVRDWTGVTPGPDRYFFRRPGANQFWNGEWFRVRRHMRISSGEGVADGRYRIWINDELLADSGPWVIPATEIWGVSLGRNRNHGVGEDMSVSFAGFTIWNENPGW